MKLKQIDKMPMLPDIAYKALELSNDPNSSLNDYVAIIERDPKFAADILCIANSVLFSPLQPIASLQRAVAQLGLRECENLIISGSLSSVVRGMSLSEHWVMNTIWDHSYSTAVIARHLNRSMNLGYHGEEFSSGLVHDFGRIIIAIADPELFVQMDPVTFDEDPDLIAQEQATSGTDHAEVGTWYAEKNRLPDSLVDVIRFHHDPDTPCENQKLVSLVATADHMANHMQREELIADYDPETSGGWSILQTHCDESCRDRFAKLLPEIMETVSGESHAVA